MHLPPNFQGYLQDQTYIMKNYIILISLAFLIGCDNSNNHGNGDAVEQLKNAEWLLGKWVNTTDEGESVEIWEKASDSTFHGLNYFVMNGDTSFSEEIRLAVIHDTLYYIPIVRDQNSGQPIYFQLKSASADQLIFENEKHDFPQFISYTKVTGDSILAEISGEKSGIKKKVQFPMRRNRK